MSTVVRGELARGDTDAAAVARRVMTRLNRELGDLIGAAGFEVMVARSLVLARRAHAVLEGVTAGPGGTLAGLETPRDEEALREAAISVVANFIELLSLLIGEDLAMRLVRDVWPAPADPAAAEEENQ